MREIVIRTKWGYRPRSPIFGITTDIFDARTLQKIEDVKHLEVVFEPEGLVYAYGERVNPESARYGVPPSENTITETFLVHHFDTTYA